MSTSHEEGAQRTEGNKETEKAAREELRTVWIRSAALSGILFLMVLYTLYFAASLTMPITLAFLLSLVLSPIVRFMLRLRIPQTLGALLVILGVAAIMMAGVYALAEPAAEWMERAPQELRRLESKLAWVKEPIEEVQEAKKRVEELTNVAGGGGTSQSDGGQSTFSLVNIILTRTPDLMYGIGVVLILLFFLLASGDAFLNKMVQVAPTLTDKKRVVETSREIQRQISVYLGTITVINLGVGAVVALAMYLLNMPNPLLWGAMLAALNFIPYLGVLIGMLIVGFVALLSFDSLAQALLAPATIFAVNIVESQFITPIIAGRQLSLSPAAVFLSLVVLGWIWGVMGVLMAVPLLATIKLVCEQIEPLEPVATFLGRY